MNLIKKSDDSSTDIDMKKLQILLYEFFILRYILHQVHIYVFFHDAQFRFRKFLITEDIFLNAYFWKMIFNLIYVKTEILHVALTDVERINFVKKFDDLNDFLLVLIIMYQISAQNVNLNESYSKMIVTTFAINAFTKI